MLNPLEAYKVNQRYNLFQIETFQQLAHQVIRMEGSVATPSKISI